MYVAYICKGSQIHRHYIIIIAMYSLFGKNSSNMLRYICVLYINVYIYIIYVYTRIYPL